MTLQMYEVIRYPMTDGDHEMIIYLCGTIL